MHKKSPPSSLTEDLSVFYRTVTPATKTFTEATSIPTAPSTAAFTAFCTSFATCEMTKDGVFVTDAKMTNCEEVAEVSDYTLKEGYRRIYDMLKGKKEEPLHFDDLELAVWFNMRDLFDGDHTLIQDARLVYDVLYRLHEEGLLKKELRRVSANRERYFMWID